MQKNSLLSSSVLCLLTVFLFQGISLAQLTGTKFIPGDFATIESAITALNAQGVGPGGVTFNVAANHTETFSSSIAGVIITTGTSANPIIFQKNGAGANPVITAGTGTGTRDGIIIITGGDYITFDGINLSENSLNTTDVMRMEWGFALLKRNPAATPPVDGCWNVTLKNSTITLDKVNTDTWGIYAANHTKDTTLTIVLTDSLDVMSYCKFYFNTITNSYNGIRIISSTVLGFQGQQNEIGVGGANTITNYGNSVVTAYGMNLEYQNNLKVANNTVIGGGSSQTQVLYGIRTGTASNANLDIYRNTVTLVQGGTSLIYGITNSTGSSGTNNTVNIYDNIVENCTSNSTGNNMWLVYNLASAFNLNIYGNIIRNNTKSSGAGVLYCIYNSPTTTPTYVNIYENEIYNNLCGGTIHGIFSDDGLNLSIYGNNIYDLRSSSTSTAAVATAGISITSGPINTYIYNNFISDLKATSSGYGMGVRGINITSTTANSNIGLFYNTIFLNTAGGSNFGSTGIYHTYSTTATTASLDMRNNIVVNLSTANGSGKTVAFRRSSATNLNNYSTISNNNCFYAGTPSASNVIYFDGTNFDLTIDDFKTRVTPRESNSVSENVPFINSSTPPYDLHLNPAVPTQVESWGVPITSPISITNDFDGNIRNAVTPDLGADEFNGMGIDVTAPSILYTILDHTTSTANRTLTNVSITDQGGVNITPGTRPRIYYKRSSDNNTYVDNTSSSNGWKYTETSNTANPYEFQINYSLLFGGTGVQNGDTVQYFVVAQDLASPPNVGIFDGTFASQPASVNLTSAAFPITGTINSYRILILLNGTVTVGTGGNYPSLTGPNGLFSTINGNILSGNLVAQIISDLNETGTNALNQWTEVTDINYTLTIQPNSAVIRTIAGSSPGGLIKLNGSDRVIIDGRFNGSGIYLTFENTNASSATAAIHVISLGAGAGCSDVTIRNCIIKAGSSTITNIFGIIVAGTAVNTSSSGGADNDNISILENNISKCRIGIFARGTSTDQMLNLNISGNIVGSDNVAESVNEYGMYFGYADAPQITYNEIYNMLTEASKWAMYITSNVNNAFISKNKIHSINQTGTGGFNSVGIYFTTATNCFDNQIVNNMIYDLRTYGNTSMYLVGIRITGGSNYKIYYNSVSITDTVDNPVAGQVSACLYITGTPTPATNMDIRNNIFLNSRPGNSPMNYAIFSPNTTTFANINHNDYWTTGNVIGYFGGDIATFNDWKTATGQDSFSVNVDPMFASETNLHINSGLTPTVLESGGIVITGITTDIDEDVRPGPLGSINGGGVAPDIGVDEFDGVPGGTTFQYTVIVQNGWNMVSVPGLHPNGQSPLNYWPGKDPGANVFKYSGGYQIATNVFPGEGYWMKHMGDATYVLTLLFVPHDPIPALTGWNLIGGYENVATVSGITTNPPGLLIPPVYKFVGGYQTTTTIDPGYGYWVKLSGAGNIILPESFAKGNEIAVEYFEEDWGKITITDATGRNFTLYAVKGKVELDNYEMPPLPPTGSFDIRYGSNRIAEDINSSIKTIDMSGVEYPLTVRVEGMDIRIMDESGKQLNENVKDGEEVTISETTINKLMVTGELIPTVYALEQNYPNPFNPTTVIEFSLPEDVSNVKLSIYNALGEKVAELVNTSLIAGKYQYRWNAQNVATGMYIYELRTDKFVSIKKMMLLK